MNFCENGSLSHPWLDNGLNPCFFECVASAVLGGTILLLGGVQLVLYLKVTQKRDVSLRPKSCLYGFQIILHVYMMLQSLALLLLSGLYLQKAWYGYRISSGVLYTAAWCCALVLLQLERSRQSNRWRYRGHGALFVAFWCLTFIKENLSFISWSSSLWWWKRDTKEKQLELGLFIARYISTLLLVLLGFKAPGLPSRSDRDLQNRHSSDPEQQALLSTATHQSSTWEGALRKIKQMWPYMWPKKSRWLQLQVLMCVVILAAGRVVNLFVPIYYKYIVDSLTSSPHKQTENVTSSFLPKLNFRWDFILIYVGLRFLQGGGFGSMGLLNNVRSFLWIRIQQYTSREVRINLFSHLHGLSLRWHLSRKTGEVLRVMDRGTTSINSILSYVFFNIVPTIADIVIAIAYFLSAFSAWFALIVFITMALYLIFTLVITEWRTKFRRSMNKLDNERNAKAVDSLLNFETVKYYGAEDYEINRYREAIVSYQSSEWTSIATMNLLNTIQNITISGGLLAGCLLCAWYVVDDKGLTVGDYVLFSTYVVQLYGPLNFLGSIYRTIQQAFIDMENMFELLGEKQEIKDAPSATPVAVTTGAIDFNKVNFHYDPSKAILKDVSFSVPAGQTFALVGPSGSGKSTIIRLLFRFYDIQSGTITIDNQPLDEVKQSSVRQAIGVVPQDTVLFNDNILYNIRYGRVTATDKEVEEAAEAADIHQRIMSFTDGYGTVVGERGLKLSGGEKQRVAIARTLLKAPKIVLLDEATSALDTQTERNIQSSLMEVCKNKTTIVVAHRLSTIVNADQILVLKDGEIIERGRHDELLSQDGVYADMWNQQLSTGDDTNSSPGSGGVDQGSQGGPGAIKPPSDLTDSDKQIS